MIMTKKEPAGRKGSAKRILDTLKTMPKSSISKVVDKPPVKYIKVYCTACSEPFIARRKDNIGEMIEQQLCPHIILKEVKYNA